MVECAGGGMCSRGLVVVAAGVLAPSTVLLRFTVGVWAKHKHCSRAGWRALIERLGPREAMPLGIPGATTLLAHSATEARASAARCRGAVGLLLPLLLLRFRAPVRDGARGDLAVVAPAAVGPCQARQTVTGGRWRRDGCALRDPRQCEERIIFCEELHVERGEGAPQLLPSPMAWSARRDPAVLVLLCFRSSHIPGAITTPQHICQVHGSHPGVRRSAGARSRRTFPSASWSQ